MFSNTDDIMYTVTVFGAFLISFFVSFMVCSAVVCYLCIKMELIEMRLIVRKPKRKLSSVCMNSRSNIYEAVEVSGMSGLSFFRCYCFGVIFRIKRTASNCMISWWREINRWWCFIWLIVCDLDLRCFSVLFLTALYKIESDDERLIVVLFGGECNQRIGDTVCLVIYRVDR